MPISLQEINAQTVREVTDLSVREDQKSFVASNAVSLAQALFSRDAWYRAICDGNERVGFVMLQDESLLSPAPEEPDVAVWRFMIDARFQGKGFGKAAMQQVIEHVRAKGIFRKLLLSYVPGPGCPEAFYRRLGFQPNGDVEDGEIVLELQLGNPLT